MQTKEYRQQRYLLKKDQILAQTRAWAVANPEKRKIIKNRWRAKNKELTNFLCRQYHYRRKHNSGKVTLNEIKKLYKLFPICPYCWVNKSDTVDHLVPLSKGGSNNFDNLVAVCRSCNSKKHDKSLKEFKPFLFMAWDRGGRHEC